VESEPVRDNSNDPVAIRESSAFFSKKKMLQGYGKTYIYISNSNAVILYPNCSEIVTYIHARNEKEVIEIINELLNLFSTKLLLEFRAGPYYYEEINDNGNTILKIYSHFLYEGDLDQEAVTYVEEKNLPKVDFSIEISPELLRLDGDKFIVKKEIQDVLIPEVTFDYYSGKRKVYSEVHVDLSSVDAVHPSFMNLSLANPLLPMCRSPTNHTLNTSLLELYSITCSCNCIVHLR